MSGRTRHPYSLGPSSGDVVVTPALRGYDIGALDDPDFHLLNNRDDLHAALRLAHWYAVARHSRVWVRRDARPFEPVVFERVGLEAESGWFPYEADTVLRHVPKKPGIYVLRATGPIFIGDTDNLQDRLRYHLDGQWFCPEASLPLEFSFSVIASCQIRQQKAAELIRWWGPPCNHSV